MTSGNGYKRGPALCASTREKGARICESLGFCYRWRELPVGRRMRRNQSGTMNKLSASLCLVLLGLTAACVRASFSVVEGRDASNAIQPDTASGGGDEPAAATMCPLTPLAGCSPQIANGAPCDPVCQGGTCPCGQKCSVVGDGTTACASVGNLPARGPCTINNPGTPLQHDDCTPGHICISPDTGSGYAFCLPLCRTSTDCVGGVACGKRPLSLYQTSNPALVSVCDPEYLSCNPVSPNPCCNPVQLAGCLSGENCYLVSADTQTHDSRTVCEYTAGLGKRTYSCASSRDCSPGWACDGGLCRQVCDPKDPNVATACPAGGVCSYTSSSGNQFGYCPP